MSRNPALPAFGNREIPWVPIIYGAIFAAAVVVLAFTLANRMSADDDILTLSVANTDGEPVPNALVTYGNSTYLTDEDGNVYLDVLDTRETLLVQHDGYMTVSGEFDTSFGTNQHLTLKEVTSNVAPSTPEPDNAQTAGAAPEPGTPKAAATAQVTSSTPSDPEEIAGTLRNTDGQPVERGWVTDGKAYAFTGADGHFMFEPGTIAPNATLTAFAPGYHVMEIPVRLVARISISRWRSSIFAGSISTRISPITRKISTASLTWQITPK